MISVDKLRTAATLALNAIEEMEYPYRKKLPECACRSFDWQDIARVLEEALEGEKPCPRAEMYRSLGEALNSGDGSYRP